VVAEGSPDQLKASAGDDRLTLTLAPGADAAIAVAALSAHATSPVAVGAGGLQLTAAAPARDRITTDVVRALDNARIDVTGIAVRRPPLDDVFLALTGREGAGDQTGTSHGGEAA
jgi:ABC-2 type transport system ATP-binding protein